ncbi:MAG: hypothetical protein ACOY0T_33750 [Myxococcota bacterium]
MLRARIFGTLAVTWAVCGCGAAQQGNNAESAASSGGDESGTKPKLDFAAMLEREVEALKPASFATKDGSVTGTIEAKSAPKVTHHEGFTEVAAPIGSEVAVSCMVYDNDLRPGASLSAVLASVGQDGKAKVERVAIDAVDAFADAGALYATLLYKSQQNGKDLVGTVKLFFHGSFEHGVMCLHDEVGYRKSFARITRGVVESLKYPIRLGKTRMVEVAKVSLGEQPVGYVQQVVAEASNGVILSVSSLARFLPVAPAEIATSDSVTILGLDADRNIVTGDFTVYEGATEALAIELERKDKGRYHYKGTAHQKPIEGDFTSKDKKGLLAPVARDKQIAELARAKKSKTLKFEEYSPDSDPSKPEAVSAALDGATRRVKVTFGEIVLDEQLAEDGFPQKGEVHIGKHTLVLDRLVRTGSL